MEDPKGQDGARALRGSGRSENSWGALLGKPLLMETAPRARFEPYPEGMPGAIPSLPTENCMPEGTQQRSVLSM